MEPGDSYLQCWWGYCWPCCLPPLSDLPSPFLHPIYFLPLLTVSSIVLPWLFSCGWSRCWAWCSWKPSPWPRSTPSRSYRGTWTLLTLHFQLLLPRSSLFSSWLNHTCCSSKNSILLWSYSLLWNWLPGQTDAPWLDPWHPTSLQSLDHNEGNIYQWDWISLLNLHKGKGCYFLLLDTYYCWGSGSSSSWM